MFAKWCSIRGCFQMDAGKVPCRDVLFKLWRRCRREGDEKLTEEVQKLFKVWGYRDCYTGEGRRRLISTVGKQGQAQAGQAQVVPT
jgi:hypothetical protein